MDIKAKHLDTWVILGSVVWTVAMSVLKAIFDLNITIGEIIAVAFSMAGLVGGITGSIWLDKIVEMKKAITKE